MENTNTPTSQTRKAIACQVIGGKFETVVGAGIDAGMDVTGFVSVGTILISGGIEKIGIAEPISVSILSNICLATIDFEGMRSPLQ